MKQKYSLFSLAFLSASIIAGFAQSATAQKTVGAHINHVSANSQVTGNHVPKDAVEDVAKRTINNSTWKTKDGRIITCTSSEPINYTDANGKFHPINISLKSDSRGWSASEQQYPCYFHSDRTTAISLGGGLEFEFNKNCTVNGAAYDERINAMDNQNIALNLAPGIYKNIRFLNNGIKTNYVFSSLPEGGKISVSEELSIPAGCTLKKDESKGRNWFGGWDGDYVLLSADGDELARLHSPLAYDANNKKCAGSYNLEIKDGKYILTTSVPATWLTSATFPVTLDPRITGPTVKHHGGSIGSCPYPAFSTDTLLHIEIPGRITVYQLDIDYAYTTKDTIGNIVNLNAGGFYFSTTCGSNPPSGYYVCDSAYPGICYLVPDNDLHVPLTCCYLPSCSPQYFDLVAHLTRVGYPLFGCNDFDYVWYDATDTVGIYTYKAYVDGYTDSVTSLSYIPASQCANICSLTMNANIQFGVPPYKVSHPWAARDTMSTFGENYTIGSCKSDWNLKMNLKIPSTYCPFLCTAPDTVISVPPPTVVDACGDTVKNLKAQLVRMKPVPVVTTSNVMDTVCSGTNPVTINLNSCVPGTNFNWIGSDSARGSGSTISDPTKDTGKGPMLVKYIITGSVNGCNSAPDTVTGVVNPYPIISVSGVKDTIDLGTSINLVASGGSTYLWAPAAGLSCTNCPNPKATPTITTVYTVMVTDSEKCTDQFIFKIVVLDENIIIPNVITPNGDGKDDYFAISGLNYYPNSKLSIYDRWGKEVYTSNNYLNDWNGGGQSDGVYYYLLSLQNGKKYKGYFQIIK